MLFNWFIFVMIYILLLFSFHETMGKISTAYLVIYNGLQCAGWAHIFYLILPHFMHVLESGSPSRTLYQDIGVPLRIFQVAAYLEVLHSLGGLVKSSPVLTSMQITSRVFLICGICENFKVSIRLRLIVTPHRCEY